MKDKTCCFTGHRVISIGEYEELKQNLKDEISSLIGKGVIYYGCGGALGFDTLCAETIIALKPEFPQIRLILVLPCPEQADRWSVNDRQKYEYIKKQADKIVYTSIHYTSDCMHKRNRHLIDNSSYCICYQRRKTGGTAYTVAYAMKKEVELIFL